MRGFQGGNGRQAGEKRGPSGRAPGFTIIELMVTVALIALVVAVGIPQYGRYVAKSRARAAAGDLLQEMRLARAMAIKENREYLMTFYPDPDGDPATGDDRYLIGFDANGDGDLLDSQDTYGICNDTDNDRLPNTNPDNDGDGVPDCVKVVNLARYGKDVVAFGTPAVKAPTDPLTDLTGCNGKTVCFGATSAPIRETFNTNGSVSLLGTAYFQHIDTGFTYAVRVSTNAGAINLFAWQGETGALPSGSTFDEHWREVR